MYADAGLTAADIADAALQAMGIATLRDGKQQGACLTQRDLPNGNGAPMEAPFSIQGPDGAQAGTVPKIDRA
jgi:hypothetical protein